MTGAVLPLGEPLGRHLAHPVGQRGASPPFAAPKQSPLRSQNGWLELAPQRQTAARVSEIHRREAIRAKVVEAESHYDVLQHHILNMHFDVQADRATGIGYMWFVCAPHADRPRDHLAMGGAYEWEYARHADGWRLTRQRQGVSWSQGNHGRGSFGQDR